jgi:cobalt-zinc-cadmium efflux system membrane fusion protein
MSFVVSSLKTVGFVCLGLLVLAGLAVAMGALPAPWEAHKEQEIEASSKTALRVELVSDFKLTDGSLNCLRAWGAPQKVLDKLNGIKKRPFATQEAFLQGLTRTLDKDEMKRYEDLALYLAQPHTLLVPDDVRIALGIRKGNVEKIKGVSKPTRTPPLVLPGSTALDPALLLRMRARFAPAELVQIGMTFDASLPKDDPYREFRNGDEVKKGDVLGVFYSDVVGNKKNDLVDAVLQVVLDHKILKRAESNGGVLPDVFIWNAQRNLQGDLNAINRAMSTLRTWVVPEDDIQKLVGKRIFQAIKGLDTWDIPDKDVQALKDKAKDPKDWGRIELKSPMDGILIERNVALNELVQDPTVNIFQIAKVDQLTVYANLPEDDLPKLHALRKELARQGKVKIPWTVQTVGSKPIDGYIDDIGVLIDPNQHTAVVKGHIGNPTGQLAAGQFISATVEMLPPDGVVEVPMDGLVEDGQQAIVFVRTNSRKHHYTMRRVDVVRRFERTAFVKSQDKDIHNPLNAEDKEQGLLPKEALHEGDVILLRGAVELKAALLDRESQRLAEAKADKGK